jgi:hypothetical protein
MMIGEAARFFIMVHINKTKAHPSLLFVFDAWMYIYMFIVHLTKE